MQLYRYRNSASLMDENRNEIEGNQVVCVLNFHGLGLLEHLG
jgi:hypothetical protein